MFEWTTPTLFVSDLHLGSISRDEDVLGRLRSFIKRVDREPLKRLVLLGDLFDFNLGYQSTLFRFHLPLYLALHQLKLEGIEIFVFTGNHDPDPSPILSDELGLTVITHPISIRLYQETVLLEHGDLLEPSLFKRLLCRLVRTQLVRKIARVCPPALSWRLTHRLHAHGRMNHEDNFIRLEVVHEAIEKKEKVMLETDHHAWIFGHFHVVTHVEKVFKNKKLDIFSIGDQVENYSGLIWDQRGPRLCCFLPQQSKIT